MHNDGWADARPLSMQCSSVRRPSPTPEEGSCPAPRQWILLPLQRSALRRLHELCAIPASHGELVQVKVLHSVKEDDPITMAEVRFALLKLLEHYAVRVRNGPTEFIFPISHRHAVAFAWRFHN